MRAFPVGAGIAATAFGMAQPCLAQTAPPERDIVLTTGVGVWAESNVARSDEEIARLRGLRLSDVRVSPSVAVDAALPFGRQYLLVNGSVAYDFYARNSQLNRERIGINSTLGLNASRCELLVNGSYTRRRSDLGDLLFVDPIGSASVAVRNTEEIKSIGADASCGAVVGLRPMVGVRQTWADNSTAFRQFSDFRTTTVTAGLGYRQPSIGEVSVFATQSWTDYDNRPLPGGENDGTQVRSYGVRYQRAIGTRLSGLVEVAYTDVSPDNPLARDFGGVTWRGELTGDVTSRLRLVGAVSRSVESSNLVASSYFISKVYSLDASYALTDRVTLGGYVSRRERQYEGTTFLLGPPTVQESLTSFGASATFRQSDRLSFVLDAQHEQRDAGINFLDYEADRVGLTARLTW